jgi:hypothetical protein
MTTRPRHVLHGALAVLLLLGASATSFLTPAADAALPDTHAATRATDWLRRQTLPNGGFAGFTGEADPGTTADAVIAFVAAGIDPHHVGAGGGTDPIAYLTAVAPDVLGNPGLSAKLALAFHAGGANPRDAGGVDLLQAVQNGFNVDTGLYGPSFFGHALAVLALHAEGVPVEAGAVDALLGAQTPEGSWGFTGSPVSGTGDSNTTAIVIQTLVAVGGHDDVIARGLDYLRSLQEEDGSIPYDDGGFGGDANSTALAVQAFWAAGIDPTTLERGDLLAALVTFQNASGAFRFQPAFPDDSLLATVQAIPALLLRVLPPDPVALDSPVVEAARPAQPRAGCDYHAPTQHNVCGLFASYWHAHGGLAIFGYALTEELDYFGRTVQYFERAVLGWHPEFAGTSYDVLPRLIGTDEVERTHRDRWAPVEPNPACTYHPVTGHNVCGGFRAYWVAYGGLAIFGYPLTEEFQEGGLTVQYFERARFEWHPGVWPERYDVLLGRLGADQVARELAR